VVLAREEEEDMLVILHMSLVYVDSHCLHRDDVIMSCDCIYVLFMCLCSLWSSRYWA